MLKVALRHFLKPSFLLLASVMARPMVSRGSPRRSAQPCTRAPRSAVSPPPAARRAVPATPPPARCERDAPAAGAAAASPPEGLGVRRGQPSAPLPHPRGQVPGRARGALGKGGERARACGPGLSGCRNPCLFHPTLCERRSQRARLFSLSTSPSPLWGLVGFGDSREWLRSGVVLLLDVFSARQESSQKAHQRMEKQTSKPVRCCQSLL